MFLKLELALVLAGNVVQQWPCVDALSLFSLPAASEGWEQNGLYEFFRAKMRARRKKGQEKRNRYARLHTPL